MIKMKNYQAHIEKNKPQEIIRIIIKAINKNDVIKRLNFEFGKEAYRVISIIQEESPEVVWQGTIGDLIGEQQ